MGLLRDEAAEDIDVLKKIFTAVESFWEENLSEWGLKIKFEANSIEYISQIASDFLFDEKTFPGSPGVFKRAAAMSLFTRMFVDITFETIDRSPIASLYTEKELEAWGARIAFLTIPIVLKNCTFKSEKGEIIQPKKDWVPASLHMRLEFLALLRWMEAPEEEDGKTLDSERLARAVMAFALIIEQSYYLTGSKIECDVHDKTRCFDDSDNISYCDAFFLNPDTHEGYSQSR